MIIYLVKSTVLLGLLYGLYKLLLENEKIHHINRFFLLFALAFGLTAPVMTFEIYPKQTIAGLKLQQMERVVNAPAEAVSNSVESAIASKPDASTKTEVTPSTATESQWSISTTDVLLGVYGLITLVLLMRFAKGLFEIRKKIKAGSHVKKGPATLVLLNESITPQTFFKFIFLEKEAFENGEIEPEILDHEGIHVRQFHSLDVLVIEFLKVIFWFNPFMYLYKRAIQLNHEFLADESVVSKTSSACDYQEMLIRACAGNKPMSATSSINYSLTKKRMHMMLRPFSLLRSGSKVAVLLPILALLTLTFCSKEPEQKDGSPHYSDVELHFDAKRNEELGKPIDTHYTSSGEPFTGTQRYYYSKNDSLYSKMYFEDGINTEFVMYKEDGDISRIKHGRYLGFTYAKEIYENGILLYENIPPTESEDGVGYLRTWHKNGQLGSEITYKGDRKYHGLLTDYDEEGNIIKQERYENDELVETIK